MKKLSSNIEHPEHNGEHKRKIIEAMENKNVEQLIIALYELNKELTGLEDAGDFATGGTTEELLKRELSQFLAGTKEGSARITLTLGDGSSRLNLALRKGEAKVDIVEYNTSKAVREKWQGLQ